MARREDHALRLVLSHMEFMEELSQEDHTILCDLPAPHGHIFVWLEGQLMEHGPMAWAVLQESIAGHDNETLIRKLMTGSHAQTEGDVAELRSELRDILDRLLIESLRQQENLLIQQAARDPSALERYKELQIRRVALENPKLSSS